MMASNTHSTNHDQPTLHHQYDVPTFAVRTTSPPEVVLPTMVALVSPNISSVSSSRRDDVQRNGDTQHPPSRHVSMAVHYLPDPYHQNSTNQSSSSHNSSNSSGHTNTNSNRMNTSNHSSSSQLRPYFLLRRERPLLPHNYDPNHPSEMGNPTTTTDATIIPSNHSPPSSSSIQYEEYYQLCEMTMIDDDDAMNSSNTMNEDKQNYHSFLISNRTHNDTNTLSSYVVQNGSLYVMTPIDSLFWLLRDTYLPNTTTASNTTSSTILDTEPPKQLQWQPLWQFLQEYDPVIQKCVYGPNQKQQQQYKHLLNEMSLGNHTDDDDNNDDDSMTLVQFSIEKALLWLHQKQQTMERYLLRVVSSSSSQQQQHHHNINSNSNSNISGNHNNNNKGAFTSGFTVAKENKITACNMTINVENEEKQEQERKEQQQQQYRIMVKEESMQLVCNYLTPAWQDHFIQYLRDHDPDYALVQWKHEPPEHLLEANQNRNKRSKSEVDNNKATTIQASITDVTTMTPTVDWNMSLTTSCTTTTTTASSSSKSKKLLLVQPITAGAKRLLKVNQRGIQSVSSFFGVGSTKNKAKK